MMSSAPVHRFAFTFGTAFAVFYVIAVAKDLALFTVFPSLGIVLAGTQHTNDVTDPALGFLAPAPLTGKAPDAPAMYWYGWAATAALGALTFGVVAALLPGRWTRYFWPGLVWLFPALSMIACAYLTLPWFRL